jgi:hypothetical protein
MLRFYDIFHSFSIPNREMCHILIYFLYLFTIFQIKILPAVDANLIIHRKF